MASSPSASMFVDVNQDQDQKAKRTKVTIVGVGQVGMAAAFSIMMQGHANHISLVDVAADKLKGEMLDLQHGQQFLRPCTISADTDYSVSAGSKIVIVTAGARQREGESRLNLVQRNVSIFKGIIPKIVEHSPDCILVIVSNPVDILTYVAWKVSGLPRNRVIGTGTMLDSARFRFQLGQRLNVDPKSCHGYIVGEHGDSSVAVWSSLNVGGVNLSKLNPNIGRDNDPEHYSDVHKEVVQSAYEIIKLKGYTSWAIGLTVSTLVGTILRDQHSIMALSVYAKGVYGINDEVYLSLPSVVTGHGISRVIGQTLNDEEEKKVRESAKTLHEVISGIQW